LNLVVPASANRHIEPRTAQRKIDQVMQWRTDGTIQTTLPKRINSILNSDIAAWIPNGISEPQVRLLGNDRFSLRVIVDIDEFKRRRKRPQSAGPLNFLSGKMPALVRGNLITGDGKGQFKLQSTEVNGIPLPPALASAAFDALKTRRRPEGFDIQKPFDLPAKIRQLQINPDELVVIQ
jgi:hypothetical protein